MLPPTWYFDFISPFAYFQFAQYGKEFERRSFVLKPVLFAGLLKHWGHKGPAEIGEKRTFTYRYAQWYAQKHAIPYRMPPAHPFPPLVPLRAAVADGSTFAGVRAIFDFFWREGGSLEAASGQCQLASALGMSDLRSAVEDEQVKRLLKANTEEAAARGVFGVPSTLAGDQLFWGVDATQMLFEFLDDRERFETDEMRRVSNLPYGVQRQG